MIYHANLHIGVNILKLGHTVVLIGPILELGFHSPKLIFKIFFKKKIQILSTSFDALNSRNEKIFQIFDSINHENLSKIFPHNKFCNKPIEKSCIANDENNLYYYDRTQLLL